MNSTILYPTVNFSDSFAVCNHLFSFKSKFKRFTIRLYRRGIFVKKLTCNFSGLVGILSSLEFKEYSDVVVFGYPTKDSFESEILFAIYYHFCTGQRCVRIYND